MAWDVNIPAAMQCGSRTKQLDPMMKKLGPHPFPHEKGLNWLTHIYEANLWLSQGRTRSQVLPPSHLLTHLLADWLFHWLSCWLCHWLCHLLLHLLAVSLVSLTG